VSIPIKSKEGFQMKMRPEDQKYEISFLHVRNVHFVKARMAMERAEKAFEDGVLMAAKLKVDEAAKELAEAAKLMGEWYGNTYGKPMDDEEFEERKARYRMEYREEGGQW
jgi:uncharacterized protein (DUF305 family)